MLGAPLCQIKRVFDYAHLRLYCNNLCEQTIGVRYAIRDGSYSLELNFVDL